MLVTSLKTRNLAITALLIFFTISRGSSAESVFDLSQMRLEGEKIGNLALVFHHEHGRCLGSAGGKAGLRFFGSFHETKKLTFEYSSIGNVVWSACAVPGECKNFEGNSGVLEVEFAKPVRHLRLKFELGSQDLLCELKSRQKLMPWSQLYQFEPSNVGSAQRDKIVELNNRSVHRSENFEQASISGQGKTDQASITGSGESDLASSSEADSEEHDSSPQTDKADQGPEFPLGVNLEAEYLFRELSFTQRKQILHQAKLDGLNSLRLHKFYRLYQQTDKATQKELFREFEEFLEAVDSMDFSVYLDLFSYPLGGMGIRNEGYKGNLYLFHELKEELHSWIQELQKLRINGRAFFQWEKLRWICLANENSLFFQEEGFDYLKELTLYQRFLEQIGFISMDDFRSRIMEEFYGEMKLALNQVGYEGIVFLSNYQLGGRDLEVNRKLSKIADRHLYLDYPVFQSRSPRIKFRLPHYDLEEIIDSLGLNTGEEVYLSEVNLPYPNPFSHELLPFLLRLNKRNPIRGVWFYDYRLKSDFFHQGGLFGIQKIRSIIEPLSILLNLTQKGQYDLAIEADSITITSEEWRIRSGWIELEQSSNKVPASEYFHRGSEEVYRYSFETGENDIHSRFGTFLKQRGGKSHGVFW